MDINPDKVRLINDGRSPIIEPGLEESLRCALRLLRLRATCDVREALRESDLCFVSVATPSRLNGQIDPAHLIRACEQIANALYELDKKQIVVIRSSILPAIFDRCANIFDSLAPELVHLCVNPEFLREGSAIHDFEEPPFTILGAECDETLKVLRSVYSNLSAPIFTLKPKEALLLKYASNAFHALKIAFANEIGMVCQQSGVEAAAVMNVFCKDSQLNISQRYLMPGFAFGGSCLPKDVRALLYAGKENDLHLPLMSAILSSNETVIDRAFQTIRETEARRIGLIGLSFKPNTDDLRESPFVELAERLLGKGCELSIYDPNVLVTKLMGTNKEYIGRVIPHLSRLLVTSLEDLADAELLLVGHHFDGLDALLKNTSAQVIDLSSAGFALHSKQKVMVAAGHAH